MREWLKKNNVLMKALALLIAVILWFFVLSVDNPERTVDKNNIPVSLIGEDIIASKYGLAIANNEFPVIDLKLKGTIGRLGNVNEDNIFVSADISQISKPGTYSIEYKPSIIDGITIVSRNPAKITITVEEIITVDLPVKVNIIGDLAKGLETDKAIVDPLTVQVQGIRSELENAAYAVVNIKADTITDTYKGNADYIIVDSNDKEIKGNTIKKINKTIDLRIPVYLVRDVELALDIIDGDGVSAADADVTITPSTLTIIGEIQDVSDIDRIVLGSVDLNTFIQNYSGTMPIVLPKNVYSKNEIKEAYVNVSLKNIDTAQLTVDKIELINVPKEYEVVCETISVVVTLRGNYDMLAAVNADSLSLVVDMENKIPKGGRERYKAKIKFADGITGIGVYGNYEVIINAAQKTVDIENNPIGG